jgi:pimeloyl-ACP methyl ester carboxylesterase
METRNISSHCASQLVIGHGKIEQNRPWVVFIIPFGLKIELAEPFIDSLSGDYNVVSWEARAILSSVDYELSNDELSVESHVEDLVTILGDLGVDKACIVGYCSGAGIALAAANRYPEKVDFLILANGEYTLLHDSSCTTQYGSDIDSILPIAAESESNAQFIIERMPAGKDEAVPAGMDVPFSEAYILKRYAENYLNYRSTDFEALAKKITHKSFILTSKNDLQANVNSSQYIHRCIDKSEIYVDDFNDHYGVLRKDSTTIGKIKELLESEINKTTGQ